MGIYLWGEDLGMGDLARDYFSSLGPREGSLISWWDGLKGRALEKVVWIRAPLRRKDWPLNSSN